MVRILTNNGLHNYLIRISILFIIILQLWTGIYLTFNYNIRQMKIDRNSSYHCTGSQSFSEPSVPAVITNQSFEYPLKYYLVRDGFELIESGFSYIDLVKFPHYGSKSVRFMSFDQYSNSLLKYRFSAYHKLHLLFYLYSNNSFQNSSFLIGLTYNDSFIIKVYMGLHDNYWYYYDPINGLTRCNNFSPYTWYKIDLYIQFNSSFYLYVNDILIARNISTLEIPAINSLSNVSFIAQINSTGTYYLDDLLIVNNSYSEKKTFYVKNSESYESTDDFSRILGYTDLNISDDAIKLPSYFGLITEYSIPNSMDGYFWDVASDSNNSIYCLGYIQHNNSDYEFILVKFDKFGSSLWNLTIGKTSGLYFCSIDIGPDDFIYIGGNILKNNILINFVAKYYPNGTQIWNCSWDRIGSDYYLYKIRVGSSGSVYFLSTYHYFEIVYFHIGKINNSFILWSIFQYYYDGPHNFIYLFCASISIDEDENLYVISSYFDTSSSFPPSYYYGYQLYKYTSEGRFYWYSRIYDYDSDVFVRDSTVFNGHIYVSILYNEDDSSYKIGIFKHDLDLEDVIKSIAFPVFDFSISDLYPMKNGNILVLFGQLDSSYDSLILELNSSLDILFELSINANKELYGLTALSDDSFVVSGKNRISSCPYFSIYGKRYDSGIFISKIMDLKSPKLVETLSFQLRNETAGNISVLYRSSSDNFTWSPWISPIDNNGMATVEVYRYFQLKLILNSCNHFFTPIIENFNLTFMSEYYLWLGSNYYICDVAEIFYEVTPDFQDPKYELFYSNISNLNFTALPHSNSSNSPYLWTTWAIPNGKYYLKLLLNNSVHITLPVYINNWIDIDIIKSDRGYLFNASWDPLNCSEIGNFELVIFDIVLDRIFFSTSINKSTGIFKKEFPFSFFRGGVYLLNFSISGPYNIHIKIFETMLSDKRSERFVYLSYTNDINWTTLNKIAPPFVSMPVNLSLIYNVNFKLRVSSTIIGDTFIDDDPDFYDAIETGKNELKLSEVPTTWLEFQSPSSDYQETEVTFYLSTNAEDPNSGNIIFEVEYLKDIIETANGTHERTIYVVNPLNIEQVMTPAYSAIYQGIEISLNCSTIPIDARSDSPLRLQLSNAKYDQNITITYNYYSNDQILIDYAQIYFVDSDLNYEPTCRLINPSIFMPQKIIFTNQIDFEVEVLKEDGTPDPNAIVIIFYSNGYVILGFDNRSQTYKGTLNVSPDFLNLIDQISIEIIAGGKSKSIECTIIYIPIIYLIILIAMCSILISFGVMNYLDKRKKLKSLGIKQEVVLHNKNKPKNKPSSEKKASNISEIIEQGDEL
ncbi:MAG: hypothetical protein ACTSRP_12520 [Candidatus Helarchaeota archaeon]